MGGLGVAWLRKIYLAVRNRLLMIGRTTAESCPPLCALGRDLAGRFTRCLAGLVIVFEPDKSQIHSEC